MRSGSIGNGRQRGAVAVLTGLLIAVLIGLLGIAVDLGRLFVIKSELQTAMDSCALAAATQLRPGLSDPNSLTNAMAFGRTMSDPTRSSASGPRPAGSVNMANFQGTQVNPGAIEFTFSSLLAGPYVDAASISAGAARYARCTYPMKQVPVLFARVLPGGPTSADVAATAVASLSPSQTTCAIPIAICRDPAASGPPWGLQKATWLSGKSDTPGYGTGDFGWVNFDDPTAVPPLLPPPECAGKNGQTLVECLLIYGQCDIRTDSTVKSQSASGVMASLAAGWNSRFGFDPAGQPKFPILPDATGWAYTDTSWGNPAGNTSNSAYDGTPKNVIGTPQYNYKSARVAQYGYQGDLAAGINTKPPAGTYMTQIELLASGERERRLALAPVVDCSVWASTGSANPKIDDWACLLMLSPTGQAPDFKPMVEYLGSASDATSPCASTGLAGGSVGPLVPVLWQ